MSDADTPWQQWRCPCGSDRYGDEQDGPHARWHFAWATGTRIPTPLGQSNSPRIVAVDSAAHMPWRRLAHNTARLAQREQGYDFAAFPYPSRRDSHEVTALLYLAAGRVRGFLITYTDREPVRHWWSGNPDDPIVERGDGTDRPRIGLIWTAHHYRHCGIATALVEHLAERAGLTPADVAWQVPFSDAGAALARRLSPAGIWIT